MSQDDANVFKLSPLSWEENNNSKSDNELSFPSTSPLSLLSKTTSESSLTSLKAKNSLDILHNKCDNDSQNESHSNAINTLESLIDENINSLQREKEFSQISSLPYDENSNKSTGMSLSSVLNAHESENSFLTLDECYNSDVDMFEDFDSQKMETSNEEIKVTPNLSDYSSEFIEKSQFAPKIVSPTISSIRTEIFDASIDEIHLAVEEIIAFLESDE